MHQVPGPPPPPQGGGYPKRRAGNKPFIAFYPKEEMHAQTIHIPALVNICFPMYAHMCICIHNNMGLSD